MPPGIADADRTDGEDFTNLDSDLATNDRRTAVRSREKWIRRFFFAYRRRRSMSREHMDLVREWPQLLFDPRDQLSVIPVREIGAADTAGKEDITADHDRLALQAKADTVRRVARDME